MAPRSMAARLTAGVALLAACVSGQAEGDASILINEIGRESNQSLLWGPYRPNVYFGIRPRIPTSLMAGLMWSKVDNFQDVQQSMMMTSILNPSSWMMAYTWWNMANILTV